MAIVEARGLTRDYRMGEVTIQALRGIDLDIDEGEVIVMLGPSGSGKTTILNLLGGLDSPTSGEVVVDGESIAGYDARELADYRARKVGFVFQFFNLLPSLTAAENIEFALALTEHDSAAIGKRTAELLDLVGLGERGDHFPGQLSGGEQQRVAIARALANEPRLLLCDEPTGSLDVETGRRILEVLVDASRDTAAAVVLVTHNSAIAPMADRVLHLRDGCIDRQEKPRQRMEPAELSW